MLEGNKNMAQEKGKKIAEDTQRKRVEEAAVKDDQIKIGEDRNQRLEARSVPSGNARTRGGNIPSAQLLIEKSKPKASENIIMRNAFIVASDSCDLTQKQAAAVALFASDRPNFSFKDIDEASFRIRNGENVDVIDSRAARNFSGRFQYELKRVGVIKHGDGMGKSLREMNDTDFIRESYKKEERFSNREVRATPKKV